jgi:hypothetical protein
MAEQTKELVSVLEKVIPMTIEAAPVRRTPYKLGGVDRPRLGDRIKASKLKWAEAHWEEAVWRHRSNFKGSGLAWQEIIGFQELLCGARADKGWGEVDLLAKSPQGMPVVIEVKSEPTELLLAAVMQAAAYGIALRKSWEPVLKNQWEGLFGPSSATNSDLWPIVVAAPVSYWQACIGIKGKRTRNKAPELFWPALDSLVTGLRKSGLDPSFVAIIHDGADSNGFPKITGARNVEVSSPFDGNPWLWQA